MKSWTTGEGKRHEGKEFSRAALERLLTNVLYRGEVRHRGEVYRGEQPSIVDRELWQKANELLRVEKRNGKRDPGKRAGELLKDLLRCGRCGSPMLPGCRNRRGRQYRYYMCQKAQQEGAHACPRQWIAARRIEAVVVSKVRELGHDRYRPGPAVGDKGRSAGRGVGWQALVRWMEGMDYDGHTGEVQVRWKTGIGEAVTTAIPTRRYASIGPSGPWKVETASPRRSTIPRISRLMALAIRMEDLLREGEVKDYADLARLGGVTRARITQIMNLRNLAPAIQERILLQSNGEGDCLRIPERRLRRLSQCLDWQQQTTLLQRLLEKDRALFHNSLKILGICVNQRMKSQK